MSKYVQILIMFYPCLDINNKKFVIENILQPSMLSWNYCTEITSQTTYADNIPNK